MEKSDGLFLKTCLWYIEIKNVLFLSYPSTWIAHTCLALAKGEKNGFLGMLDEMGAGSLGEGETRGVSWKIGKKTFEEGRTMSSFSWKEE